MPKPSKKVKPVAVPLDEFLKNDGGSTEFPAYEVELSSALEGLSKKVIDLSKLPSAPKSSFEIVIKEEVLKKGPPYEMALKNLPYETTVDEIKEFLENQNVKIELMDDGFKSKGLAKAFFNDLIEYKAAFEKDGLKLGKRAISLYQGFYTEDEAHERDVFGSGTRGKYFNDQRGNYGRQSNRGGSSYGSSKYSGDRDYEQDGKGSYSRESNADKSDNWRDGSRKPIAASEADQSTNWRDGAGLKKQPTSEADQCENWRAAPKIVKQISEADQSDNWRDGALKPKIVSEADRSDNWREGIKTAHAVSEADQTDNWRDPSRKLRIIPEADRVDNWRDPSLKPKIISQADQSNNWRDGPRQSYNKNDNSRYSGGRSFDRSSYRDSDRRYNSRDQPEEQDDGSTPASSQLDQYRQPQEISNISNNEYRQPRRGLYRGNRDGGSRDGGSHRSRDTCSAADQASSWRTKNTPDSEQQIKIKQRPKDAQIQDTSSSNIVQKPNNLQNISNVV